MLQDGTGNVLAAEHTQASRTEGRYYVTTRTTVMKSDRYRCVVTYEAFM